jgi:hypothetical protein
VPSSVLEIVELANGDIVLQRADGEGDPIVNISFSDETAAFMSVMKLEIAKAMFQAGIQTYTDLIEQVVVDEEEAAGDRIVH